MPAPDYETIFNVEDAIEDAAKSVLTTHYGIAAYTQREIDNLPAERVDIELRITGQREHRVKLADGSGHYVRDAWNGVLKFTVTTKRVRGSASLTHGKMRGRVRMACEYFTDRFTAAVLPYHVLTSMTLQDSDPQVNVADALDLSALHFAVVISVRPGAWPTWADGAMWAQEDGATEWAREDGSIWAL